MTGQYECYEIVKPNKHQSTKIYLFTKLDWDSKSHMIGDYANTGAAILYVPSRVVFQDSINNILNISYIWM